MGQAEDLAAGGDTAAARRAGTVDDYRSTHASRVHRGQLLEHPELGVGPADLTGAEAAAGDGLPGLFLAEGFRVVAGHAAVAEVHGVRRRFAADAQVREDEGGTFGQRPAEARSRTFASSASIQRSVWASWEHCTRYRNRSFSSSGDVGSSGTCSILVLWIAPGCQRLLVQ